MKDEFYKKGFITDDVYRGGLIIKIVANLIFLFNLAYFAFCMANIWTFYFKDFLYYFAIFSAHFLPFATFILCGVLLLRENILCKEANHAFALISLILSVGAVVSEIFVLITVGGIHSSELLYINGGFIFVIWACWVCEFIIRKVKDKKDSDLSRIVSERNKER